MTNFFWLSFLAVSLLGYMSAIAESEDNPTMKEVLGLKNCMIVFTLNCNYSSQNCCVAISPLLQLLTNTTDRRRASKSFYDSSLFSNNFF